jgi:hypothetical protein
MVQMKTTKHYRKYQRLYGPHFTKDLCDFAVSMMEDDKGPITPITKQQLEEKLKVQNITLQYNKMYDAVYVANMCKADYLGDAVPNNDYNLCMYVKKTIDDPDGYDGQPFNRWMSDIEGMHVPVDWSEFV